jgi:membrane protease YdiL (CAAX protease family)
MTKPSRPAPSKTPVKTASKTTVLEIGLVFIAFFALPMVLSRFVGYQTWGGYLAPILLIFFTWLLYQRRGRDLSELGLRSFSSSLFFPLGLILGVVFATGLLLLQMVYNGWTVTINRDASWPLVMAGFLFLLQGVLNEELIFRGYCFKETVDRVGPVRANLLFGFLFIVWHWISLNAWGNYGLMVSLVTTGFGHLLFATAFLRSKTLYLPIGIHLGNNWASRYLFDIQSAHLKGTSTISDTVFLVNTASKGHTQAHTIGALLMNIVFFLLFAWGIYKWVRPAASFPHSRHTM